MNIPHALVIDGKRLSLGKFPFTIVMFSLSLVEESLEEHDLNHHIFARCHESVFRLMVRAHVTIRLTVGVSYNDFPGNMTWGTFKMVVVLRLCILAWGLSFLVKFSSEILSLRDMP